MVAGGLAYLWRPRRVQGSPPRPATVSTGIYELGADGSRSARPSARRRVVGGATGLEAVALVTPAREADARWESRVVVACKTVATTGHPVPAAAER